jgi:hypothetical protein
MPTKLAPIEKPTPVVRRIEEPAEPAEPAPAPINGVSLWSPKGNLPDGSMQISLTSGHSIIIPHDRKGVPVPKRFRSEAIARGCLPVGMEEDAPDAGQGPDRTMIIRRCIQEMMDSSEPGLFTTSGQPALPPLSARCGFTLSRNEVNRVFDEMNKPDAEVISSMGTASA